MINPTISLTIPFEKHKYIYFLSVLWKERQTPLLYLPYERVMWVLLTLGASPGTALKNLTNAF